MERATKTKPAIWEKNSTRVLLGIMVFTATMLSISLRAFSWSSEAHIFIAREAGVKHPEVACFPDLAKEENINLAGPFHWHDAAPFTVITPDYIDRHKITEELYGSVGSPKSNAINMKIPDPAGVLYWKIVELYQQMQGTRGWVYEYYLTAISHYVGDLSQPLHNFPYADHPAGDGKTYPKIGFWAKKYHEQFDQMLDSSLPWSGKEQRKFNAMITLVQIDSEDDLKKEIAKIANTARNLANTCYAQKRLPARDEALRQMAMSVSLLRAIINAADR